MKRWKRFLLLGFVFILLTGCTANHSGPTAGRWIFLPPANMPKRRRPSKSWATIEQSAQYAAYSRGLVLWEQGDYLNAEPYFAQSCKRF